MQLDIRFPIGAFFTIVGLILFGYSLVTEPSAHALFQGMKIDLYWGLFLVAFGVVMLVPAWLAMKAKPAAEPPKKD